MTTVGLEAPGGLLAGAIVLGAVHGVEPGHGWPVAAAYAMDRSNAWAAGLVASLLIGIGHLISSIAVVLAYFYAIAYFDLTDLDDPIVIGDVAIGGPLGVVAGLLLIGLGVREYYRGGHGYSEEHTHDESGAHDHDHEHRHGHAGDERADGNTARAAGEGPAWRERVRNVLPGGGHQHLEEGDADRGLLGIAWVAFVLGFAHEEEFEIIALCTGSTHCLELMLVYAVTVVLGIVGLTMALVAGYQHFEERVERIVPYLPAFSAAVLIVLGLGFVLGLL